MNAQEISSYYCDQPPSVVRLEIEKHFEALTDKQKRYAHFISRYGLQHLDSLVHETYMA